ncbi:hypothetical protein [Desulfothermobacter acidiphilus]|uniref:hypothetical protein n=1 Tax=Desulfothermobacter acidiphilus TaxID=1938353 RepID=UPI003F8C0D76
MGFLVAFDLEGPLSPQDNAFELMGRLPQGQELFERLSRYDDLLVLEGRPGYEPGDTLALIVPFLLAYGIREDDIRAVSASALLTPGSREVVAALLERGFKPCVISTSYCQHAYHIASLLGLGQEWVACTSLPLDAWQGKLPQEDRDWIKQVAESLLKIPLEDDERLREVGERFFWQEMPRRMAGSFFAAVKVVGGRRKTEALSAFARRVGIPLERVVAVGDSITDFHLLGSVREAGGLSIVFNGNAYSLPYGTCAVAALHLSAILPLVEAFAAGGLVALRERIASLSAQADKEEGPFYHWLPSLPLEEELVAVHARFRELLRGRAARLG